MATEEFLKGSRRKRRDLDELQAVIWCCNLRNVPGRNEDRPAALVLQDTGDADVVAAR